MVAPAVWAGLRAAAAWTAKVGVKSKGFGFGGDEDPQQIIHDAQDPTVSASEVLARAKIRSRSGALLSKVEQLIAARGPLQVP